MSFLKKRMGSELKRQGDIMSLKDKKKATESFQILKDAEHKIERASTRDEVREIIDSARETLRGIYSASEEHDHSRFQSFLIDLFEDGVKWVESKNQ